MNDLRPVSIQELSGLAEGRRWQLEQRLPGIDSLTPVRGHVHAIHRGSVLELEGEVATIVTLCCDRCLQHFNQPLAFQTRERVRLEQGEPGGEHDADALSESLDPRGRFDPAHWAFEQLSLQLPPVNRCGADCPGPASWSSAEPAIDPRWAALQRLKS